MGIISGAGINQVDLVDLLQLMNTKFTALCAKLDDDSVVSATDYESGLALTFPKTITECGVSQGEILSFLDSWIASFNTLIGKLDDDAGVGIDDNYESTLAITDIINASGNPAKGLYNCGVRQGNLVDLLQTIVTNYNALLTKLDADPLGDSNYASTLAITDTINDTGC